MNKVNRVFRKTRSKGGWEQRNVPIYPITNGPKSHFCGFHDIDPWDPTERYMLALEAEESDDLPRVDGIAKVGIIDMTAPDYRFTPLAETRGWNWHVGARQQWLDERRIIYNDRQDSKHIAVILDIESGAKSVIDSAVWAISPDRCWAIAPNFARLGKYYPTYGYVGGSAPSLSDSKPEDDGLYLIDLKTGESKLLFSVAEIVSTAYVSQTESPQAHFWLTHPTFNTDGSGFCFYLRRYLPDGYLHSNFFYADLDGRNIKLLLRDLVSHFDWFDPSQIVIWGHQNRKLTNLRTSKALSNGLAMSLFKTARAAKRAVVGSGPSGGFKLLDVRSGETSPIGDKVLVEDGHNMFSPDRAWMISDTYVDKTSRRVLYLYHIESGRRIDIGMFPSARRLNGTPATCDMHPRWNRSGTQVCVDSAQDETRQIYVADVEEIVSGP